MTAGANVPSTGFPPAQPRRQANAQMPCRITLAFRIPPGVGKRDRMARQSSVRRLLIIFPCKAGHSLIMRALTERISPRVRGRRCALAFRDSSTHVLKETVLFISLQA